MVQETEHSEEQNILKLERFFLSFFLFLSLTKAELTCGYAQFYTCIRQKIVHQ